MKAILIRIPAVVACGALIVGILSGWYFAVPQVAVIVAAVGAVLTSVTLLAISKFRSFAGFPLLLALVCLGILKITSDARDLPRNSIGRQPTSDTITVTCIGWITDQAIVRGQSIHFTAEVESIFSPQESGPVGKTVEGGLAASMYVDSSSLASAQQLASGRLHEGARIAMSGYLVPLPRPRNPGEFDYGRYLRLHGVYARIILLPDSGLVVLPPKPKGLISDGLSATRRYLNGTINKLAGGEEANLLRGLLIGERTEMSPEVKTAFMNSGLMHILAVSGFNVGLVLLILVSVFSFARLDSLSSFIMTSIGLILFGLVTGAQASVFRAVVMAILFLGGRLLERRSDMFNTLAAAALLLLLIDSRSLFDAGFQLSFLAVAGLAYFYPRLEEASAKLPDGLKRNRVWKYFLASVAVTLAATLGTIPLTMLYFQKISLVGILLNMLAVPLSGVILALGFAAVAASLVSLGTAKLFALPAILLSKLLLWTTMRGASLPYAFIEVHPEPWMVLVFSAMLLYVAAAKGRAIVGRLIICGMTAGLIVLGMHIHRQISPTLEVTFFDIGQGDAALVRTPRGAFIMIDCGPSSKNTDAGERFIYPYLHNHGIHEIHTLLISHPHSDHIGGGPYLLRHVKVDTVIDDRIPSQSRIVTEFLRLADSAGVVHVADSGGCVYSPEPGVSLYVLHPTGDLRPSQGPAPGGMNNQSLVVKLVYGKTSILFSGDAQTEGEERMLEQYGDFLGADILKIGHHGSSNATSFEYLNRVHPSYAVISLGARNKFHHPSPKTLVKLDSLSVHRYRTDEHGAVVFRSDGTQWEEVAW